MSELSKLPSVDRLLLHPAVDSLIDSLGRTVTRLIRDALAEARAEVRAAGRADLVAFGRQFICNPDLVRRLREDAPLNALDARTLYGGGAKGYTDYPCLP